MGGGVAVFAAVWVTARGDGTATITATLGDKEATATITVQLETDDGTDNMVLIPAGEFLMGSNDPEARNDEQPVHTVYVDAFYMDIYEVTNAQYKEFVDANPGVGRRVKALGWGQLPER